MSVCIAVIAKHEKAIVIATDRMASMFGGTFSSDDAISKGIALVSKRWSALFAGDDIGFVAPVLDQAKAELEGIDGKPTRDRVAQAMLAAYHATRAKLAVDTYLSVYGMDMPQFLANGASVFGDVGFGILRERIEQVSLDVSFLVCGFDDANTPHVFVVEHPGVVRHFTQLGYWAIGSGALTAIGRLAARRQSAYEPLPCAIYNACEAKTAAESAAGVGKQTILIIAEAGKDTQFIPFEEIEKRRKHFQRFICPPVPKRFYDEISSLIQVWRPTSSSQSAE